MAARHILEGDVARRAARFGQPRGRVAKVVLVGAVPPETAGNIVPYADASLLQVKLLQDRALTVHDGFPQGMPTTQAEIINPDLLAFVQGGTAA